MQAARNNFDRVARFDLEDHLTSLSTNNASGTGHPLAERCRCEVSKLNFSANGPLIGIE
jgi:hypothetical protein